MDYRVLLVASHISNMNVSISEWIHMGNLAKRHQINIKAELGIFYTLDVQVNMLSTRHKSEPKI